jgi:very-short-patch-repair endonuclease
VGQWWVELPTGRVIRLAGACADTLVLSLDPLPAGAPAILGYRAQRAAGSREVVALALGELDRVALELFPAWLPGAEHIGATGGAGGPAVRELARRLAAASHHFGPFLADLAQRALARDAPAPALTEAGAGGAGIGRGGRVRGGGAGPARRFPMETCAAGLARVLAASYGRTQVALLVEAPAELSDAEREALVVGCEWLARHGGFGVWLVGAPAGFADHLPVWPVRSPDPAPPPVPGHGTIWESAPSAPVAGTPPAGSAPRQSAGRSVPAVPPLPPSATGPAACAPAVTDARTAVRYPALAGRPHPGSRAERALEAALAAHPWAVGRVWNQIHHPGPLDHPIRIDLLWREERCAVEIDGPDHRESARFAADRLRDVRLQTAGYAVLRFTNEQVLTDLPAVLHLLERFLRTRRCGASKG